jgi:hypothetical protein
VLGVVETTLVEGGVEQAPRLVAVGVRGAQFPAPAVGPPQIHDHAQ